MTFIKNTIVPKAPPPVQPKPFSGIIGKRGPQPQRVDVVNLRPPEKLVFRAPKLLESKVVQLQPPKLKLNADARSRGIENRKALIIRAGRPKGMLGFISLPGLSTGYKSVLKGLDGFKSAMTNVTKDDGGDVGGALRKLDAAAANVQGKAEKYLLGEKHTRKDQIRDVLKDVKAERKMIASLLEQLENAPEIPKQPLDRMIALARGGVPLEEMSSYNRYDMDTLTAMFADNGPKIPLETLDRYIQNKFSYNEAVLLEQSGLGIKGGNLYRQFDMPIVPNTMVKNFDDAAVEDRGFTKLGSGAMNSVYTTEFKTGSGLYAGVLKPLSIPDKTGKNYVDKGWVMDAIGVNISNPQVGLRNVAVCDIAKKLGFDVVPHTEIGIFKDDKNIDRLGVVMSKGEGIAGRKSSQETLKMPEVRREITKLQLLDQIVGQGDRHGKNYVVQVHEGKVTVTGYDNDQCLGKYSRHPSDLVRDPEYEDTDGFRGVHMPGVIDREMAQAIRSLTNESLAESLKGLDPKEIDAAKSRLKVIKRHINDLEKDGKIIEPENWGSKIVDKNMSRDNSYFARDLNYRTIKDEYKLNGKKGK